MRPAVLQSRLIASTLLGITLGALPAPRPAGAQSVAPQAAPYDIVIRNGRVLDGAGNPWILADVAIKDGKFAAIGMVPARGRVESMRGASTCRPAGST